LEAFVREGHSTDSVCQLLHLSLERSHWLIPIHVIPQCQVRLVRLAGSPSA